MDQQNIKNGIRFTWRLGVELAGIALIVGVLIFGLSLLPEKPNTSGSNQPALTEPTLTPSSEIPTATPEPQGMARAADGEWVADTQFGRLILSVGDAGEKLEKVTYQFSDWTCGVITTSGVVVDASRWLITANEFTVMSTFDRYGQLRMELTGKYDGSAQAFSGNWFASSNDTTCGGKWTASFLSPEAQAATPTVKASLPTATQAPQTYTVKEGDTWYSIAYTFGLKVWILKMWNANAGNDLYVGQILKIGPMVNISQPTEVVPEGATVVNYFASGTNQDFEAVKAIAGIFNRSQLEFYVQVTDENGAFGFEGFDMDRVIEKFDCFAETGGLTQNQIQGVHSLEALIEADPDGNALREDISPDLWSAVREKGAIYGLPVAVQPLVIYYNKNHLNMDQSPQGFHWTVNDFWSAASIATNREVYGFVPIEDYSFLFQAQGIELIDWTYDPPRINFDNPETLQVVRQLAEQVKNGVVPMFEPRSTSFTAGDSQRFYEFLRNGRAAMWTYRAGFPSGDYESHGYTVGVAPLPMDNGTLNPYSAISIFISRHAEDPSACWQWAKFLSSQPGAFLGIPVRQSVLDSPNFDYIIGSENAAAYRTVMQQPFEEVPAVEKQWQYPTHPLRKMWSNKLYAIFQGADPAATLTELQKKGEAYLSCITQANLNENTPDYFQQVEACALRADPNYK